MKAYRSLVVPTLVTALGLVVCLPTAAAATSLAASGTRQHPPRLRWRGPEGVPLPFRDSADAVDFLRNATIVSVDEVGEGSTRPKKVLLERDGVRAHAIFRSFERVQERVVDPDTGQTRFQPFKDSALFEAAAYELATMLDLPFVPPTTRRVVDNRDGTLQLWIESAMSETQRQERGIEPPNATWWRGVLQALVIFDNLASNADRNTTNLLIDPDWGVWFIDHTRAFQQDRDLRNPEHIGFIERRLFRLLRDLPDADIRERMSPYLDGREIGALLRRRARIVEHIETLIERQGEGAVLFDYSYNIDDWRPEGAAAVGLQSQQGS